MGLNLYILSGVLTLDNIFVIEGNAQLGAVRSVAKDVDTLLLGEVLEAARACNRVKYSCWSRKGVRSRLRHLPEDVELLAIDLFHNDRNLWLRNVVQKFSGDFLLKLQRGLPRRLDLSGEWQRDSSIRSHRNRP